MFTKPGTYTLRLGAVNGSGESSRTLVVTATGTALTEMDIWRYAEFGTTSNAGDFADNADPDKDGILNLMEFASNLSPKTPSVIPAVLVKNGTFLEYTYTRNPSAAGAVTYIVEWSDSLAAGSWSTSGVTEQSLGGNTIKAVVPAGSGPKRFVRLRITQP